MMEGGSWGDSRLQQEQEEGEREKSLFDVWWGMIQRE